MASKAAIAAAERRTAISAEQRDATWKYATHVSARKIDDMMAHSRLFSRKRLDGVPTFGADELTLGAVVQRGVFGTVRELRSIECKSGSSKALSDAVDDEAMEPSFQDKKFIAAHCLGDGGEARYCIKALSPGLIADKDRFAVGALNLAVEALILSGVSHPHILPIRAFHNSLRGPDPFLVLDRLCETLEARIRRWRSQSRWANGVANRLRGTRGTRLDALMGTQLRYAGDLAGALKYLHAAKLLHRNVKPQSAGFNVRGDIVLCNFGLARFVPDRRQVADGTWKLTGETGSLRYMAPEVASNKPYGYSADIFSFGILLWEMLAMAQPFTGFSRELHSALVVRAGARPTIEDAWGPSLTGILTSCWCAEANKRPTAARVSDILQREAASVAGMEGGLEKGLGKK